MLDFLFECEKILENVWLTNLSLVSVADFIDSERKFPLLKKSEGVPSCYVVSK